MDDNKIIRVPKSKLKILSILFITFIALPFRIRTKIFIFNSVSIVDIALLFFSIALLSYIFYNNGKLYVGNKTIFLLLFTPLIIGIFSIAWSEDIFQTIEFIVINIEAVLSYLVTVNLLRKSESDWIMSLMANFALLVIISSILSYFRVTGFAPYVPYEVGSAEYNAFIASYYTRLSSPLLGLSNALATVLAYLLFPIWAWYILFGKKKYSLLTSIILFAIIMTISKGTLLAILITIPFFFYWQKPEVKRILKPLFLAVIISAIGFVAAYAFSDQFRIYAKYVFNFKHVLYSTGAERFQRFQAGINLIERAPILGYGAGVISSDFGFQGHIHNAYLELMVYFGIPLGIISIASLIMLLFGFKHPTKKCDISSKLSLSVVSAILCQLIIFFIEASYEGAILKVIFYFCIGISVALVNSLTHQANEFQRKEL